jgi:hypothetical protein
MTIPIMVLDLFRKYQVIPHLSHSPDLSHSNLLCVFSVRPTFYFHSLWKATKKFKRPTIAIPPIRNQDGSWARTNKEKTNLFADYLATVFTPNNNMDNNNEDDVETFLNASCQ